MKKKIYMAGCGGMLGEAFYNCFKDNYDLMCTDIDVNEDWLNPLDFRNYDKYLLDVKKFKPDYLFHIGAHTDLEYCELNQDDAYQTNTSAVENAVQISNKLNIPILYISTAGIFDGRKKNYDETDLPNPGSHYAKSKYMGELFVKEHAKKYLICRAGWMMGGGPKKDKKFIQKIILQVKQGNKELFVVNDKTGTPTYTHDFANNVKLLLKKNASGLYNMVCSGSTTRLEVAKELLTVLGLEDKIKVTEVYSSYWKKDYPAPRPDCESLINKNLDVLGLNIMRDWRICLKEYIEDSYKDYLL
ncbi:SDR family oxidoreductase [Candidatus Pelagibacter sp.]|nr:SDR family oxidoreductase [Candidatus Pelagibacter sp.]